MTWFKAEATKKGKTAVANVTIDRAIGSDWAPDWIKDFTGEQPARDFIDAVEALGDVKEIVVNLNSPGGDVASGVRIFNYLKNHPAKVTMRVEGMAASIATVIMMAGDERIMGVGSTIMVHNPAGWAGGYYTEAELREMADGLAVMKTAIINAYVDGTGKTAEALSELLDQGDTYMDAEQAIEWGFAHISDESIKAVATADMPRIKAEMETAGKIRMLESDLAALANENLDLMGQLTDAQESLKVTTERYNLALSDLEAIAKQDAPIAAEAVIARCSEAGFESLALDMIKQGTTEAALATRLEFAAKVKSVATAAGINPEALIANLEDPIQLLSAALVEAKAEADAALDSYHVPTAGKPNRADARRAYAQLNNQLES